MNLNELTIVEAANGLKNKKFSSVELTKACLARIARRNKDINAFITVANESALVEAKRADDMIAKGDGAALTGIPFAVKDAICTADIRATGAAKILDNYTPPFDATVIKKIRAQGAVLVGKNNCDTFGHGASNENSMYGAVRNPHDLSKVSGGSSGGTAAAVADHMALFGIGEDTGGSIRQPASFCGLVGLRPSYGRNSRYGVMPMASSLDTVGPLTKTVEDTALVMETIAGFDVKDATTVPDQVPKYSEGIKNEEFPATAGSRSRWGRMKNLRVGVPKEYFEVDGIDPEVAAATEQQIKKLQELGCEIKTVSLPHTKYAIAVYYIIVPSEDSSNLGRLDGVRYGVRVGLTPSPSQSRGRPARSDEQSESGGGEVSSLHGALYDLYAQSRAQGFPEEVKRRILIGTYALSAGYYDAYYKKAAKVRTLIIEDFKKAFTEVDLLITPTSPFPAFGVGEKANDPLALYLADAMLAPSSVAGVPALSVPAGKTKAGLPVGVQIIGPRMSEVLVMGVGKLIE